MVGTVCSFSPTRTVHWDSFQDARSLSFIRNNPTQHAVSLSSSSFPLNSRRSPRRRRACEEVIVVKSSNGQWQGEVVPEQDGRIRGCTLQAVTEGDGYSSASMPTEWILTIDGEQADLGRFSEAIYKKLMSEAKQQRFQGFRPGTIPPHLEPTYKAIAMDECARETVLEALQQNNIRPFDEARATMFFSDFQIPPPKASKKKNKNKKSNKKRKNSNDEEDQEDLAAVVEPEPEEPPAWRTFETMKEAISAGWKPGQSFSFVATKVKGQKVKDVTPPPSSPSIGGLNL